MGRSDDKETALTLCYFWNPVLLLEPGATSGTRCYFWNPVLLLAPYFWLSVRAKKSRLRLAALRAAAW
jgi:hypothetical protein